MTLIKCFNPVGQRNYRYSWCCSNCEFARYFLPETPMINDFDANPKLEVLTRLVNVYGFHGKDVKFIAKYNIHLVTCVTKEKNIVKFFFNREPDIQGIIEGKDVVLTGKVKTHDVSKFSQCKETVFNYVKIEQ